MILDTSIILAIYFNEAAGPWAAQQMQRADRLLMSTVNLAECLIRLYDRHQVDADEYEVRLLNSGIQFVPPDRQQAILAAQARLRFPLNFGDCFAYALAKLENDSLLAVDADFRSADIAVIYPPKTEQE